MQVACSLPTADWGGECTAPFACLSCCFTSWQLVTGRWALCQGWAALPLHLEGCLLLQCVRRRTLLQVRTSSQYICLICRLQKKASVNAVLLMLVAKLHIKPQHSWFSCFCALRCPGIVWMLGGLWENLSAQPPSNTHMSLGIEKEEYLVYEGDFSCFPDAEHEQGHCGRAAVNCLYCLLVFATDVLKNINSGWLVNCWVMRAVALVWVHWWLK